MSEKKAVQNKIIFYNKEKLIKNGKEKISTYF